MTVQAPINRLTVVNCEGLIDGALWPFQSRVTGLRLETSAEATDKLTLTLDNQDGALLGHPATQRGTALDVRCGYADDMSEPRRVYLDDLDNGFPELEITFSGHEWPMNREAKVRSWTGKSETEVVREVANDNGFSEAYVHVAEMEPEQGTISQTSETDAAFLRRLATTRGFEFYTDAGGLYWRPAQKANAPTLTLSYGRPDSRILRLHARTNLSRHVGRVDTKTRDMMQRKSISAHANSSTEARPTLGEVIEVVDPNKYETARQRESATVAVHMSSAPSAARAQQEAERRFANAESSALELTLLLIGTPSALARQIVRISHVPRYLAGNYYASTVVQIQTQQSYTTELRLRRDGGGHRLGQTVAPQAGQPNMQRQRVEREDVEIVDADKFTGVIDQ